MEYLTREKTPTHGFFLPMAVRPALSWARGDEPFYTLVFAEGGTLSARTNSGEAVTGIGASLLFLRPGHSIAELRHDGGEAWGLVFKPESLNTSIPSRGDSVELPDAPEFFFFKPYRDLPRCGFELRPISYTLARRLSSLFRNLDLHLNVEQGDHWPCMARSFMLETLIMIDRDRYAENGNEPLPTTDGAGPMGKVYEYLRISCGESLTLDGIAARFATNRTDLNAAFKKAFGVTVMACLGELRMEIAATMLRNTELAVFEIAGRTGFPNEAYFARRFRTRYGSSPTEYRKSFPDSYA
jgi:AraC-like DNA-binding protein